MASWITLNFNIFHSKKNIPFFPEPSAQKVTEATSKSNNLKISYLVHSSFQASTTMTSTMYPGTWPTIKEIPMMVAPFEKKSYLYSEMEVTPSMTPPLSYSTPASDDEELSTAEKSRTFFSSARSVYALTKVAGSLSLISPRMLSAKIPIVSLY